MSGSASSINPVKVVTQPWTIPGQIIGTGKNVLNNLLPGQPSQPDNSAANTASADLNMLLNQMRSGQSGADRSQLLSENEANLAERQKTLESQKTARDQQLSNLANILAKQSQIELGQATPGMLEDLQSRGLLRSSAVGNKFAEQQRQLSEVEANQLAQQALANQQAYTAGLGGITEADIAGKGSATQRQFSLSDMANQLQAAKDIGITTMPQQAPQGKSSGGLTGALGGAGVGSKFGAPGAIIGGIGGGLLGAGKK